MKIGLEDAAGNQAFLRVFVNEDGPVLVLVLSGGDLRLYLWLFVKDAGPSLVLSDTTGNKYEYDAARGSQANPDAANNGTGLTLAHTAIRLLDVRTLRLHLYDDANKLQQNLRLEDMEPQGLFDAAGRKRAILCVTDGGLQLFLFDENEKKRAMLAVGKVGPALALYDENGRVIWQAP